MIGQKDLQPTTTVTYIVMLNQQKEDKEYMNIHSEAKASDWPNYLDPWLIMVFILYISLKSA